MRFAPPLTIAILRARASPAPRLSRALSTASWSRPRRIGEYERPRSRPIAERTTKSSSRVTPEGIDRRIDRRSMRSEEHTSELQSRGHLVCRLLLATKNKKMTTADILHDDAR